MLERVYRIAKCDRGATAVEYGLIVSLIVIAIIAALGTLAGNTQGMWNNVSNKVTVSTR
ncbi:MAG: pilus assembly protein [Sphingomonadales bacterium 28-55-16]|jgi:pilus assembly protein Flp/PilA|nr:MAG: pilus assembly protein [Sphingomonadales bacterium 28-55-16]